MLVRARCATALASPSRELLHALKYGGWTSAAPWMAVRMVRALSDRGADRSSPGPPAAVVPVPTTPRRRRLRGYNQANVLAVDVARLLDIPHARPLHRREGRSSQTALLAAERAANVEDAFVPGGPSSLPSVSHHVILVDDVLTTGATAAAAARALEVLGVSAVTLLAFARTLPGAPDDLSLPS